MKEKGSTSMMTSSSGLYMSPMGTILYWLKKEVENHQRRYAKRLEEGMIVLTQTVKLMMPI